MLAERQSPLRILSLGLTCWGMAASAAFAEPGSERLLASAAVTEKNGCAVVKIDFNVRIQYQNHTPLNAGDELRVQINPLDSVAGAIRTNVTPETLRAPASELAAIHAIELERIASTTALKVYFKRNVAFKVAQGIDFRSILISVSDPKKAAGCNADETAVASATAPPPGNGLRNSLFEANKAKAAAASGPLSAQQAEQAMIEARAALDKNAPDRAVQLLTKIVESGDEAHHAEAQELLGVARERRGQLAHARAEYQEYLRVFPAGPGAARVRERLVVLEANGKPAGSGEPGTNGVGQGAGVPAKDGTVKLGNDTTPASPRTAAGDLTHLSQPPKAPADWTFSQYGSISTFYNLNQGGRGFIETPRTNTGWDREDPYKTYQSAFLSSFDYDARYENAAYTGRFKFSATQQTDLIASTGRDVRISSVYFDARFKDSGLSVQAGRQSATTGGALGRYDGALASYQASDTLKLNAIAGSPVLRSSDTPFESRTAFYGASADVSHLDKSLQTTGYVFEQRTEGLIDRQAVGAEVRYVKERISNYGALEYDVHFGELNSAVWTGSMVFADQSSFSFNADYRRAPILLATNALQGQDVYTLSDLLRRYSSTEIDQLALDRTAQSTTVTSSVSRPINSWLQWSADLTVNYLSGMPASGGVDSVRSTGMAYFASAQLIGAGVFSANDSAIGGLRYANTSTSDRYMLDLSVSYPLNPDWRVNPMLKFGYADYKTESRQDYEFIPSVRTSYALRPDTMLEFEVGGKLGLANSSIAKEYQSELLILAGVRYDFSRPK